MKAKTKANVSLKTKSKKSFERLDKGKSLQNSAVDIGMGKRNIKTGGNHKI